MGQKNKIVWTVVLVVVLVIAVMVKNNWYVGVKNQGQDMVKIGVIAPLSGDAAAYGEDMQKVLNYRLAEINTEQGTKFQLAYEDGKCGGNDAVTAFQKLTNIDGVKFIIGGGCSGETLGIAPLTKDGTALAISALSSNPTIEGASPYLFSLSYTDEVIGQTLAKQMGTFSKVAIISEQGDYSIGVKNVWEKSIATYPNVKVVADEVFPKGASDVRSLLTKVRNAHPDAILLNPLPGVTATTLLKQLAEMKDWTGYKLYGQLTLLADNVRASTGNFTNGMTIVDAPDLTAPNFLAYKAAIEKAEGPVASIGNYYTASTADALTIMTSLIRKLGTDTKTVRDALSSQTFSGYLGTITFDGHSFKEGSQGGIYLIQNGKAVYQQ